MEFILLLWKGTVHEIAWNQMRDVEDIDCTLYCRPSEVTL